MFGRTVRASFSPADSGWTRSALRSCGDWCKRILPDNSMSVDALLRAAERQTGISEWDEFPFQQGLAAHLEAVQRDMNPDFLERLIIRRFALRFLMNRLCTQAALRADPEIARREIRQPIVVLGFPRTGTTMLHNLLSLDPQGRPLLGWEAIFPVPLYKNGKLCPERRLQRCEWFFRMFYRFFPDLAKAHAFMPQGPEECSWLLMNSFLSYEWCYTAPSFGDWLANVSDEYLIDAYRLHRRQLQILQGTSVDKRWVLKAPSHFYGLAGLTAVYPDAVIVQTHRDPNEVVGSSASMATKAMPKGSAMRKRIGENVLKSLKIVQDRGMAARDRLPAGRVIDIRYTDMIARPAETVHQIYQSAGLLAPPDLDQRIQAWLKENPQHKHGRHTYDLQQYGLTPEQVEEQLGARTRPYL